MRDLENAIRNGDVTRVAQALDSGTRVDTDMGPNRGTLLELAIETRQLPVVRLLVSRKANVEARTSTGHTPLMVALLRSSDEVIQFLLEAGADPLAVSEHRQTTADVAFLSHRFDWIEKLRALGVRVCPVLDRKVSGARLRLAAATGDVGEAKRLLAQGADPDGTEWDHPLAVAIQQNHVEVVRILLEAGARPTLPDSAYQQPWSMAAGQGRPEMIRMLVEKGATLSTGDWNSVLMAACSRGDREMLELALQNGASRAATWFDEDSLRHQSAVEIAMRGGHVELAKILRDGASGTLVLDERAIETNLRVAVMRNDVATVKELVRLGATYDQALRFAVLESIVDMIAPLVRLGADPDSLLARGTSLLMHAERMGPSELATALRAAGARKGLEFLGQTRDFFKAIFSQDLDEIRRLVQEGADLQHPDDDGRLPLDAAEFFRRPRAAKLLEELGARRQSK